MAGFGDQGGDAISINITPMMDVFSILITFLLMSYSTDPVNVDPKEGTELPNSLTLTSLDEIPTVSVSKTTIYINDNEVLEIQPDGDVAVSERDQGAIRRVYEELLILKENYDKVRKAQGKKPKLGSLTFQMDKGHDFRLARRLMLSAQQAEYVTFKLMVKKSSQ